MATAKQFDRFTSWSGTVGQAIEEGISEAEEVGAEFREIVDNAPENLKSSELNSTRESTADALENLDTPSVNSSILEELDCSCNLDNGKVYRGRQTQSRACRAQNGAAKLRAAADAVREWLDAHEEIPEADDKDAEAMKARAEFLETLEQQGIAPDDYESAREEADELIGACENAADEIENAEYPGMFG
jgi:hypothetical protein